MINHFYYLSHLACCRPPTTNCLGVMDHHQCRSIRVTNLFTKIQLHQKKKKKFSYLIFLFFLPLAPRNRDSHIPCADYMCSSLAFLNLVDISMPCTDNKDTLTHNVISTSSYRKWFGYMSIFNFSVEYSSIFKVIQKSHICD